MNPLQNRRAIGIDLGGTKINAAVVSEDGKLERELQLSSKAERGPQPIIAQVIDMIRELDPSHQLPVGIGVAGQVHAESGNVLFAPNLQWTDVPLRTQLEQALGGQPVAVLNDVRAHTWGEWLYGAGKGYDDFVCLFIGTGVGGGIVSGGRLINGATNMAGELGHLVIDPNGPACGCGNRGCLEAFISGIHMATQAQECVTQSPVAGKALLQLAGNRPENITARTVAQAYHARDPLALALLDSVERALVIGAVNIAHTYNPQRLILGGGVITGFPHLVACIREGVRKRALRAASEHLEIVEAALGNDAALLGAAAFGSARRA